MKNDPGIQWIRDIRITISKELGNDPQRLVAFHKELQDARKTKRREQKAVVRDKQGNYDDQ